MNPVFPGISLADAFAAALAKEKKAEIATGDPEFKALEKEIKVLWLQPKCGAETRILETRKFRAQSGRAE